jgi:hypothetical protein
MKHISKSAGLFSVLIIEPTAAGRVRATELLSRLPHPHHVAASFDEAEAADKARIAETGASFTIVFEDSVWREKLNTLLHNNLQTA